MLLITYFSAIYHKTIRFYTHHYFVNHYLMGRCEEIIFSQQFGCALEASAIVTRWPLQSCLNKSECMDCLSRLKKWLLQRGGHSWRFDCNHNRKSYRVSLANKLNITMILLSLSFLWTPISKFHNQWFNATYSEDENSKNAIYFFI